jgi:NTE family protein
VEKIALVLSAGGMFGAYQAGVWSELASAFDPDIVVGASAGSLNAWMIACGSTPEELIHRWLHLQDASALRWRLPRSFDDGCIDGSLLEEEIRRMCRLRPVREFGVVLTRLPSMRVELFRAPNVDWVHIAASCAVPGVLRRYKINGAVYADGGMLDPLPLWAAFEMGATRVVTVNVMKHRPWIVRQGVRALRICACYRPRAPQHALVVDVSPDRRLGSVRDTAVWSRHNAARWIEQGRTDAARARHRVVELSASAQLPHS